MKKFPFYKQLDAMDCGPSCLRMIAKHYGKTFTLQTLREKSFISREGVSLLGISDAAEYIGMRSIGVKISYNQLESEATLPCIVHWKQEHFVVVYKIKKDKIYVSDPAKGLIKYDKKEFIEAWISTKSEGEEMGICLLLEPTPDFYSQDGETLKKSSFKFLFSYFRPFKKFIVQLVLAMLLGSILQLILPFLTQSIVDIGINNQDIDFIYLVLVAQLVLYTSSTVSGFIRSWILLHVSTRINISLISDFLIKLMKLPVRFFDTKMIGDILQRIGDHKRIETFLTSSTLSIVFSMINLVVFGIVLGIYNMLILGVFVLGSGLYSLWIYLFMKKRRELDFKRFEKMSENQTNLIQLINGMQEIKLNNCEKQKRWSWENIQAGLFRVNVKTLSLEQFQQAGGVFFNETKNILISFIAATAVINGDMTLGMMLAVQYIIGQLKNPVEQLISFMHATQDAKISLERLGEIHDKKDEEDPNEEKISHIAEKTIRIQDLSYQYDGPHSPFALKNVSMEIPHEKITAIVGTSGSGKTTLIKMLLGFYEPVEGEIRAGDYHLNNISKHYWRQKCGVVMQDGFIFSDTIAKNISVSDEIIDRQRLFNAVAIANIGDFIQSLPLGFNTKIGADGHGLSQGQKQRILIARAVYKEPDFIFFDEATNALDANNELQIMTNLERFFRGRTVIIVAHRLSTVKNADNIIVLEKGHIVESGNHTELVDSKGYYYKLVKNQLELGN